VVGNASGQVGGGWTGGCHGFSDLDALSTVSNGVRRGRSPPARGNMSVARDGAVGSLACVRRAVGVLAAATVRFGIASTRPPGRACTGEIWPAGRAGLGAGRTVELGPD
jgi:hypothetical protein